jgi:hypothetical protein
MNCLLCNKKIYRLYNEEGRPQRPPEQDMWKHAGVHEFIPGYGSRYDSVKFIIGICDECIDKQYKEFGNMYLTNTTIDVLIGQTLSKVISNEEEIIFYVDNKPIFKSYHMQDCCEDVGLVNTIGNLDDIVGSPIIYADQDEFDGPEPQYPDSYTWTYQVICTEKGKVRFEWLGTSNGYYSERVHFGRI